MSTDCVDICCHEEDWHDDGATIEFMIDLPNIKLELQKTKDIKTLYLSYYNTDLDDDEFVKDFYYQVGEILDRKELKKNED